MNDNRRLTFVQYAGDFREAALRLAGGGAETYRGQRYTVDYVEGLASTMASVATIAGMTDTAYDEKLPSGTRTIGGGFKGRVPGRALMRLVAKTRPDIMVLRTPARAVMVWAALHRVPTLLLLADSFNGATRKSRLSGFLLAAILRLPMFTVVANHGRRAAEQLVAAGVPAGKTIAWDYPPFDRPDARKPKTAPSADRRLLYVGLLIKEKGVHDLIHAVDGLRRSGFGVHLDLIGRGDDSGLQALIRQLDLQGVVRIVGAVPNNEIIQRMAEADAVVVPSRHEYSEGLPLTIYEGFCSRTPLVVSDHPMFAGNVEDRVSGLVFPSGDIATLSDAIRLLMSDPELYAALSANAEAAWRKLQIPAKWHEIIDHWLDGSAAAKAWLARHSLGGAG